MPDFDAAITKTIEAQRRVADAARDAGKAIEDERLAEDSAAPVVVPEVAPLPPIEP